MDERQIDKLLTEVARGNNAAFEVLYEKTKRGTFSFIYSYLKCYEDTEDVMQNVYLKIKLNIDKYTSGTNGRAWILQIAKNLALNELNKRKRVEYLDEVETRAEEISCGSITEVMQKELSEEEYRIVTLHILWGYKHREIGEMINCPTGTVTSKYKRSIKKLKQALKEAEQ